MKQVKKILLALTICSLGAFQVQAQQGIHAAGGEASGSGGSASYSIGQVFWNSVNGSSENIIQGVQQAFEISEVSTDVINQMILTECIVYPNPTSASVILLIETQDLINLRYQLYDINGRCILEGMIRAENTEVPLEKFSPSTYLLKILKGDQNIRTFKIIKN